MNTLQIDNQTTSAILAAIHQYILEEDYWGMNSIFKKIFTIKISVT